MKQKQNNLDIDKMYRKYADSHFKVMNGWLHVTPMAYNRELFEEEVKKNPKFAKKWSK